jgi:hypothetical protein
MLRFRWIPLIVIAGSPLLMGGWSLNYPTPGSYVNDTDATGAGNADAYDNARIESSNPAVRRWTIRFNSQLRRVAGTSQFQDR